MHDKNVYTSVNEFVLMDVYTNDIYLQPIEGTPKAYTMFVLC